MNFLNSYFTFGLIDNATYKKKIKSKKYYTLPSVLVEVFRVDKNIVFSRIDGGRREITFAYCDKLKLLSNKEDKIEEGDEIELKFVVDPDKNKVYYTDFKKKGRKNEQN